jgi:hypothetical protein
VEEMKILKSKAMPIVLSASILTAGLGPIGASAASHSKDVTTYPTTSTVEINPSSAATTVPTTKTPVVTPDTSRVAKDSVDEEAKLKILASALRAGGWVLEKALSPLSKTAAAKVKKYRLKIANGLEKVETTSQNGISKALQKAKIPKDVADDLAKIIVSLLL